MKTKKWFPTISHGGIKIQQGKGRLRHREVLKGVSGGVFLEARGKKNGGLQKLYTPQFGTVRPVI